MKTAISVPDETYEQATALAKKLGLSRSEFFAQAAQRYASTLSAAALTEQINQALETTGPDDSSAAAVSAGHRHLSVADDDW